MTPLGDFADSDTFFDKAKIAKQHSQSGCDRGDVDDLWKVPKWKLSHRQKIGNHKMYQRCRGEPRLVEIFRL